MAHTEVCNDSWDYDTVQSPTILDLEGAPEEVRAIGAASKSGYYSTLDARPGPDRPLPYITRYSRPHRAPTAEGTVVCPGIFGGIEYGPAALERGTRIALRRRQPDVHALQARAAVRIEARARARTTSPGRPNRSARRPASSPRSTRRPGRSAGGPLPRPANGGTLATAGGLVLVGDDDGYLYALDDRSGKLSGATTSGGGSARRRSPTKSTASSTSRSPPAARWSKPAAPPPTGPARLFVFRLGDERRRARSRFTKVTA